MMAHISYVYIHIHMYCSFRLKAPSYGYFEGLKAILFSPRTAPMILRLQDKPPKQGQSTQVPRV